MENNITLSLKDFGPINEAKIDIGKITVVGGQNASGKSTSSKIFYSFLKFISIDDVENFFYRNISVSFNELVRDLDQIGLIPYDKYNIFYQNIRNSDDLNLFFEEFNYYKEIYYSLGLPDGEEYIDNWFSKTDFIIKPLYENTDNIYNSLLRLFFVEEFLTNNFDGVAKLYGTHKKSDFNFFIDLSDSNLNFEDSFESKGWFPVHDVLYIDSCSIFDITQKGFSYNHIENLRSTFHKSANESFDIFDERINEPIINIENKINEIIGGEFRYEDNTLTFMPKGSVPCRLSNTASGIKQIGRIQLLLAHRKLKENSCLIFDEPEVNLHPEWQVKLAGILALISSSLDVLVYINTHSPIFIEAIEAFSEFYGLSDETNYYLTELQDNGKYNFNKIEPDDLYLIYDNLGKPFDYIDAIKKKP